MIARLSSPFLSAALDRAAQLRRDLSRVPVAPSSLRDRLSCQAFDRVFTASPSISSGGA